MTYRINENVILPFQLMPIIQEHPRSVEVNLKVKAIFERTSFATTVVVKVVYLNRLDPSSSKYLQCDDLRRQWKSKI